MPHCSCWALGSHNTSKGSALHTRLSPARPLRAEATTSQGPLSGRVTGVSTTAMAAGMWSCGGLRDVGFESGPWSPSWGMGWCRPSALLAWQSSSCSPLQSEAEKCLPQSLIILERVRGRRGAASKALWLPPRSLPASLEPWPRRARPLAERDTRLRRATQLWPGKEGADRPGRGKNENQPPFILTPPAAACRSLFLSLLIKAKRFLLLPLKPRRGSGSAGNRWASPAPRCGPRPRQDGF